MSEIKSEELKTIGSWIDVLSQLYGNKAKKISPTKAWAITAIHASAVGEALREGQFENLVKHLGQSLGSVMIFFDCAKNQIWPELGSPFSREDWDGLKYNKGKTNYGTINDFSEVVNYHYPKICPHCTKKQCRCAPRSKFDRTQRKVEMIQARFNNRRKLYSTWSQLEERFADIYDEDDSRKSPTEICFHFLEEIGEVSKAIEILTKEPREVIPQYDNASENSPTTGSWVGQLVEELADVVSWSTSVVRRIKLDLETYCELCEAEPESKHLNDNLSLEWVLTKTYLSDGKIVCPTCKNQTCIPTCTEF